MKGILIFLLTIILYSCSNSPKYDCKIKIRNLLFEKYNIFWESVYLGERNCQAIKVYNPTDSVVNLKGITELTDCSISSKTCHPNNWVNKGINIPAKYCDTIFFTFHTIDTNKLGLYIDEVRFAIDGHEQYQHFVLNANIQERFKPLSPKEMEIAPIIEINSREHDFGNMYGGERKTTNISITNKGKTPLIIRKIETSCGCTVPTLANRIIPPNQSTTLEIGFQARGKLGKQNKTITIHCNDPQTPIVKYSIRCFIEK